MKYSIPIDVCIICNKPMSHYSQHISKNNGWSCTLCSDCIDGLIVNYGTDGFNKFISPGGLISQIKEKLDTLDNQKNLQEVIYSVIKKFLEEEEDTGMFDNILDSLS